MHILIKNNLKDGVSYPKYHSEKVGRLRFGGIGDIVFFYFSPDYLIKVSYDMVVEVPLLQVTTWQLQCS